MLLYIVLPLSFILASSDLGMPQRKGEQRRRHTDEQIDRQAEGLIKKVWGFLSSLTSSSICSAIKRSVYIGKCIQGTGGGQGYVPILSNNIIKVVL